MGGWLWMLRPGRRVTWVALAFLALATLRFLFGNGVLG